MVKILLNTVTRECVSDSNFLGFEGENQANVLDFSFSDKFIDGTAVLNIKRGKDTGFVSVDKVGSGYQLPVKSSLLSQVGDITFQFVITKSDGTIMKFDSFVMTVEDAIDTDVPLPEEYPSWVEMANMKLAEIDASIEKAEKISSQLLTDKANGVFDGKDGANGTNGISPIVKTEQTNNGAKITITDVNGTHTAELLNGEKGEAGVAGERGPRGETGPAGPQGPAGKDGTLTFEELTEEQKATLKGDRGPTGPQGIQGPQGPQGIQGPVGATGPQGPAGPQGPKGDTGDAGATGPAGANGLTPHIGGNGNWWIGETDTGVKAEGSGSGGLAELPIATSDVLGGIKVGEGLEITEDGVLSALGGGAGGSMVEIGDCNIYSTKADLSSPITIELTKSILDFDFILFEKRIFNNATTYHELQPHIINVQDIVKDGDIKPEQFCTSTDGYVNGSYETWCMSSLYFLSANSLKVASLTRRGEGFVGVGLGKVYGIKLNAGGSSGSSYREQELLSAPLIYKATNARGNTALDVEIELLDDVSQFDALEWVFECSGNSETWTFVRFNNLKTSNIVYHNSTAQTNNSSLILLPYGTVDIGFALAFWFKDGRKLWLDYIEAYGSSVATLYFPYVRISSIKGIKY